MTEHPTSHEGRQPLAARPQERARPRQEAAAGLPDVPAQPGGAPAPGAESPAGGGGAPGGGGRGGGGPAGGGAAPPPPAARGRAAP
ncbi:serine/threonine protein phosphatase, partial [Streptomyces sp. NPDC058861]